MKIQVISDLHTEFGLFDYFYGEMVNTDADILVLAGDIGPQDSVIPLLRGIREETKKFVVFVPGNHEYYNTSRARLDRSFKQEFSRKDEGIYVLTEESKTIGDVTFLGSTGWWDGSFGRISWIVREGLNDFRKIQELNGKDPLMENGVLWGKTAKRFFQKELDKIKSKTPAQKVVCVTHHYPHPNSLAPAYEGSVLNVVFGNRWEDVIEDYQPDLWIHGHTHTSFDYKVGKTRVLCNPKGYPQKYAMEREAVRGLYKQHIGKEPSESTLNIYTHTENPMFNPSLVVEL